MIRRMLGGREVAAEDLFAESARVATLRFTFAQPTQSIRLATRANPRSQGQEAWVHAIRLS